MREHYVRLMDALNGACVFAAGVCLVVITIIIPYGVFCRYMLNSAASWPEPMAVLLMIVLSFLSAVVCYREHLHIGVGLLPNALSGGSKALLGWLIVLSARGSRESRAAGRRGTRCPRQAGCERRRCRPGPRRCAG